MARKRCSERRRSSSSVWVSRPKKRKDSSVSNERSPGKGASTPSSANLAATGRPSLGAQRRQERLKVREAERRPVLDRLEVLQDGPAGRVRLQERLRLERSPLELLLRKDHVVRHLQEPFLGCGAAVEQHAFAGLHERLMPLPLRRARRRVSLREKHPQPLSRNDLLAKLGGDPGVFLGRRVVDQVDAGDIVLGGRRRGGGLLRLKRGEHPLNELV